MSGSSMSSDYAQFRETFFAECAEILTDMDSKLSRLASDGLDREELDAVFRAVHSIKAGAGMFNYAHLVQFAHSFEALLDRMRDGRMLLNAPVASLIVRAGDVLAELVSAAQDDRTVAESLGSDVAGELHSLLSDAPLPSPPPAPQPEDVLPQLREVTIGFSPKRDLLRNANEPLLLIRELRSLGSLSVACDTSKVPALDALEVDDCYLSWSFHLTTTFEDAAILEVFEFVEDDAEISICTSVLSDDDDDGFGLWLDEAEPLSKSELATNELAINELAINDQVTYDQVTYALGATPNAALAGPAKVPANRGQDLKASEPKALEPKSSEPKASGPSSIRVDLNRVDRLVNMVGELVIAQAMLRQELSQLSHVAPVEGLDSLEGLTRELQDCVMAIRMQPVRSIFSRMPRLVREVAGKLGKQVRLELNGEQTELDKTVIEELSDPLTHMIRNSVDHGIEMPDVRLKAGKPAEGKITLSAAHVGSNILLHIDDDGAGLNRDRLLKKAIEKGVVAAGARLSDDEITDLIFAPGFSTAAVVSDVSGRGVGMDVVRRNIQKIGGRIQVSSIEGQGTRFTLVIPLTLAVLDGMLVKVGCERYILPLTSIIESFRPIPSQIRAFEDGGRVANIRGDYVRLLGLNRLFGATQAIDDPTKGLIVLVETASGRKIGLVVDELIGQQQVVIKSLQDNYSPVPGLSGATILGDGNVALILDIEQLHELQEQIG